MTTPKLAVAPGLGPLPKLGCLALMLLALPLGSAAAEPGAEPGAGADADAGPPEAPVGTLETVAELPVNPGNLAVTAEGRVFATVHQFRPADARLIEVTGKTSYAPWPNEAWNGAFASGPDVLNAPLGVQIDDRDRLWVLDNGLPLSPDQEPQAPKLVAFAIDDGQAVFRHDFAEEAGPAGSFLNDLAVDAGRGFVYFADLGRNAISLLGADGEQRILVQDERLSWPDALSFGEPRWLYVAVNQLHLSPPLNNGGEGGEPPFLILRLRTRDAGQAGR